MNFKNKNVLIFGFGKSGESATKLLKKFDANIFVYDKNLTAKILNDTQKKCHPNLFVIKKNIKKLKHKNFQKNNKIIKNNKKIQKNHFFCGFFVKKIYFFNNFQKLKNIYFHFCILSPAVPLDCDEVIFLKKNNVRILSELELGAYFCKGRIFAITGTNGKTTSVNLLHQIFATAGKKSFLCGNVGIPICDIALKTTPSSLIVCEVSSFQLEHSKFFKPFASCILNLAPDHLDRHKNLQNYGDAKNKINMHFATKKIFNVEDKNLQKYSKKYENAIFFDKKTAKKSIFLKNFEFLTQKNNLLGEFNKQNLMACVVLARLAKIKDLHIKKAIQNFKGLPHRLEIICQKDGVIFINDSKSTNPLSTQVALDSVGQNVILLLGGSGKNLDFAPIFDHKILAVVTFGESRNKIVSVAKNTQIFVKQTFDEAVKFTLDLAQTLRQNHTPLTVLLSPACASFDEFSSYAQRGDRFREMVL